jgi:hypothetical protein
MRSRDSTASPPLLAAPLIITGGTSMQAGDGLYLLQPIAAAATVSPVGVKQ